MAIDILLAVQASYPDASLYLNGSGPLRETVINQVSKRGVPNVHWIDVKSFHDLEDAYRKGDISISPCTYSNGNIGSLEAAASGMPLLISDHVDYHGEQIRAYGNGAILPLGVQAFSDHIIRYIRDPALLEAHSINSKQSVMTLRNEVVADALGSIIRDITS